ncbi:MAG: LysM peptidoglycan-binding domain-containing protein [Planctomycetaceae bacterium]
MPILTFLKETEPKVVPATQAVLLAKSGDNYCVAYTDPAISVDTTRITFPQRKAADGSLEVGYKNGQIEIQLSQTIYMLKSLTECEKRKWMEHEQHHLEDNRGCLASLEAESGKESLFQAFFLGDNWFPSSQWPLILASIEEEIGDAFRRLTKAKVDALDSTSEYDRVFRAILRDCPDPVMHEVVPGETLSGLSRRYYGTTTQTAKIADANGIKTTATLRIKQKLKIPKQR